MRVHGRRLAVVAAFAMVVSYGAGFAYAGTGGGPGGNGKGQGGSATITGDFDNNCKEFDGGSDKDISNVVIVYQDGTSEKQEFTSGHTFSKDSSKPMKSVTIKSGTKSQTFECPECQDGMDNDGDGKTDFDKNNDGIRDADSDPDCDNEDDDSESGPKPQCSDGVDNNDPEDTLGDAADPGCHSDRNVANPSSYDPNDNDETNTATQCSDGVDNADPEDTLADANDPGCHTDGNPNNPGSFNPDDNDETNGGGPTPQCSDGVDNSDPEDTLADAADPGCHSDRNVANPSSYDPNDNDETNTATQCSDGVDNADPEDTLADANDPGCHTDGNPNNPGSFNPDDNDETNGGGAQPFLTCRASALRIEDTPLEPLIGDPFEPFVANDAGATCTTDNGDITSSDHGSLLDQTIGGAPGDPGSLHVAVLQSRTDAPGSAEAGVVRVELKDATGTTVLSADVLTSSGTASCAALTNSSKVLAVSIGGQEIDLTPEEDPAIDLGPLGVLHLNYNETSPDGSVSTQRALFLDNSPLGDVIVAETVVDRHNC